MMINLAAIAERYQAEFEQQYAEQITRVQRRALEQIIRCHTPEAGTLLYHCEPCHQHLTLYPSCGHRHCPACQHRANGIWLDRQRQKLLPVNYYLVTFTIPMQLRRLFYSHQTWAYQTLFQAAKNTLLSFFERDNKLGDHPGFIGVLHTHSRKLDYHPHVHFVVPAGSVNKRRTLWQNKPGKYLFKAENLAIVFRGKLMDSMRAAGYPLPANTPKKWNADCQYSGRGDGALTYLARYLYRGVIAENNILSLQDNKVTFQYKDSNTKQFKTITEPATDFLWRVLQHVLPRGFRRARDFGFLHGNAKKTLARLQIQLKVCFEPPVVTQKRPVCCPKCQSAMLLLMSRFGHHLKVHETI